MSKTNFFNIYDYMRKYILTENQIKKIVDEIVAEQTTIGQISELYKVNGHEYQVFKLENGIVKAGHDGILGEHNVFIPWSIIINLYKKFKKQ
jgi:hypothetical protein